MTPPGDSNKATNLGVQQILQVFDFALFEHPRSVSLWHKKGSTGSPTIRTVPELVEGLLSLNTNSIETPCLKVRHLYFVVQNLRIIIAYSCIRGANPPLNFTCIWNFSADVVF